jgi:hypothetical protein
MSAGARPGPRFTSRFVPREAGPVNIGGSIRAVIFLLGLPAAAGIAAQTDAPVRIAEARCGLGHFWYCNGYAVCDCLPEGPGSEGAWSVGVEPHRPPGSDKDPGPNELRVRP